MKHQDRDYVFGLDIGTRNVVGTVGYKDDRRFVVVAQCSVEHESRAMLDGQIHDIGRVSGTIDYVKRQLEKQVGFTLTEVCIAAAGRVLRTVTTRVEMNFDEEQVVTGEDLNTLDLMGIDQAQRDLLMNNERYKFYCVGYTVMKYYLNGERFSSIEGHKANRIEEVIIVTFLPEDVVDGLYSAVERLDLTVANLTLEPIAAINVAIPENFRMLNIALVDVGAGTSDICITKDGSIIAYGMIPYAGDELTEVLVQEYLVDFATAEQIKKDSTEKDEITYSDIMGIEHHIKAEDVWKLTDPVMEKITTEVAAKIKDLNGDESVAAAFIVGGGGKVHDFCSKLADKLGIMEERVALRGEEVMKEVTFEQKDIKKDPLLVTPIGICLNYYEAKNRFIMVRVNDEFVKLYDNGHLKIVDAALQAGYTPEELFPKRGAELTFTVNGQTRMVRGTEGESAIVRMNGNTAGLNDRLEPNSKITVETSTEGEEASYRVDQLDEFAGEYVVFVVNGRRIKCPKFVEVNGSLVPGSYVIGQGDAIETLSYYTVGQLAEFMDVEIDEDYELLVNNRSAETDTLIYENFTIDWTVRQIEHILDYDPTATEPRTEALTVGREATEPETEAPTAGLETAEPEIIESRTEQLAAEQHITEPETTAPETAAAEHNAATEAQQLAGSEPTGSQQVTELQQTAEPEATAPEPVNLDELSEEELASRIGKIPAGMGKTMLDEEDTVSKYMGVGYENTTTVTTSHTTAGRPSAPKPAEAAGANISIHVNANGQAITLSGKKEYMFADIFTGIEFDVNAGEGRQIETTRNGEHCTYTAPIFEGDVLRIFWKDI